MSLYDLSKPELIEYCKMSRIKGYSNKNKEELINYIQQMEQKDFKVELNEKEALALIKKFNYTIYGESPLGIIWRPSIKKIKPKMEEFDRSRVNYYTKQWEIYEKPKGKFFTFSSKWENIRDSTLYTIT